jgi:hypothetical protein
MHKIARSEEWRDEGTKIVLSKFELLDDDNNDDDNDDDDDDDDGG